MAPIDDDAPVTLDELADLQAGLLDDDTAGRLRTRVDRDPAAAELLGALELVRADLAAVPDEPIPDEVTARVDAAIAAEQRRPAQLADQDTETVSEPGAGDADVRAPVVDLAARRRRRLVQAAGGLVAAAAIAGVVVGVLPATGPPPRAGSVPAYGATDLASAWPAVQGLRDLGPLADPQQLDSCLNTAGIGAVGQLDLLGARPIIVDGRPAVLVAAPAPATAGGPRVVLVAFDPGCGPDAVLAQTSVAR